VLKTSWTEKVTKEEALVVSTCQRSYGAYWTRWRRKRRWLRHVLGHEKRKWWQGYSG